jgi:cyclopropane fatty-acyl-phospholipid synthase-like methyltransferase
MRKALTFPAKFLNRTINHGPLDTFWWLKNHVDTRKRERQFGIATSVFLQPEELGYAADAPGYDPISYADMDAILDDLEILPTRDVFVDIGSGLGRAVVMAATRPFKRVEGIELNEELYKASVQQLERARAGLTCKDIAVHQADATTFKYPVDSTVLFIWNSFLGEILDTVLERIRQHHSDHRIPLTLFYAIPYNDQDTLQGRPWLRERREIKARFWTGIRVIRYTVDSQFAG